MSIQQSSATPKKKDVGRELRKIVGYSHSCLAEPSCITSFWHGIIPTVVLGPDNSSYSANSIDLKELTRRASYICYMY